MRRRLLLAAALVLATAPELADAGWGFVNPQSSCRIRCENGGVCTFLHEDPRQHSCVCMIGMFSGDRCQYPINEATTPVTYTEQATQPPAAPADPREYARQEQLRRREEEERRIQAARQEARRRLGHERSRHTTTTTTTTTELPISHASDWENDYHEDVTKPGSNEMLPKKESGGGWDQQSISEDPAAPEEIHDDLTKEDELEIADGDESNMGEEEEEEQEDYLGANELEKDHEIEEKESTTVSSTTTTSRRMSKGDRSRQWSREDVEDAAEKTTVKDDAAEEEDELEGDEDEDEDENHDYVSDQEADPEGLRPSLSRPFSGWMMRRRQAASSFASSSSLLLVLLGSILHLILRL